MNLEACALAALLSLGLGAQAPHLEQARSVPVPGSTPAAEDIEKIVAPLRAEIRASFEQPLVEAPKGLFRGRGTEENLLGYWICDLMRARGQALVGAPIRFAINNRGGIRANLRPGTIKVGDIFEVMPFENELVVMELTGAEIIQVVREGLIRRGGEPCSGVRVRVDGTPDKPMLTVTWEDGSPIDPMALVKVATTDYLFGGGDSIPTLKLGRKPFTTGLAIRQLLLDACQELGQKKLPLVPPQGGRFIFSADIEKALLEKRGVRY